jgi:hypothetical protein
MVREHGKFQAGNCLSKIPEDLFRVAPEPADAPDPDDRDDIDPEDRKVTGVSVSALEPLEGPAPGSDLRNFRKRVRG